MTSFSADTTAPAALPRLARLCSVLALLLAAGSSEAAVSCGDAARSGAGGNRSCSTPAEQKAIGKLIDGAWVTAACDTLHPIGWRTRPVAAGGALEIVPNPSSFLAEMNFRASVRHISRAPTQDELARRRQLERWEPDEGAASPADFDAWLRKRGIAAGAATPLAGQDAVDFRYRGTVFEGLGEDSEEYDAAASIRRDAQQGSWRAEYTIREYAGMYSEPDSPMELGIYTCSASDKLSIDAFASVCTAVWESMMLSDGTPGQCVQEDTSGN